MKAEENYLERLAKKCKKDKSRIKSATSSAGRTKKRPNKAEKFH